MDLWFVREGAEFTIYAMKTVDGNLEGFLSDLQKTDPSQHGSVWHRLEVLADHGPVRRKEQFRDVGDDLFELKTKGGSRVLFFYEPKVRRIVICTHGFPKGPKKVQTAEIKAGKAAKRDYERTRAVGERIRIFLPEGAQEPERQP